MWRALLRTLSLTEAAKFLRVHPETLRQLARQGKIPGAKVGRAWVFLEEDLAEYLRSLYASPRQALRVTLGKEVSECHFATRFHLVDRHHHTRRQTSMSSLAIMEPGVIGILEPAVGGGKGISWGVKNEPL